MKSGNFISVLTLRGYTGDQSGFDSTGRDYWYKVKSGDTMGKIWHSASGKQGGWDTFVGDNKNLGLIKNQNDIKAGQTLWIPDGTNPFGASPADPNAVPGEPGGGGSGRGFLDDAGDFFKAALRSAGGLLEDAGAKMSFVDELVRFAQAKKQEAQPGTSLSGRELFEHVYMTTMMTAAAMTRDTAKGFYQLPRNPVGLYWITGTTTPDVDGVVGSDKWGSPSTIETLLRVGLEWDRMHPGSKIPVNDISLKDGRRFARHDSHTSGRDVDFLLMRNDGKYGGLEHYDDPRHDKAKTEDLLKLLIKYNPKTILYNDTEMRAKYGSRVTYWPKHYDHQHVQFR